MVNPTRGQRREGERLLKLMKPKALAEAKKVSGGEGLFTSTGSALGAATLPHLRLSNVAAVLIYRGDLGGWIADLLLKDVPFGYPNLVGTPVGTPLGSRKKAEESAHSMLVAAAVNELRSPEEPDPDEPADIIFDYHGYAFTLPKELTYLAKLGTVVDPRTAEEIIDHLKEVERELFPKGVDHESLNATPRDQIARLMSIFTCLLAKGVFRYPAPTPYSPA
mgnify:CR=1 FL=1